MSDFGQLEKERQEDKSAKLGSDINYILFGTGKIIWRDFSISVDRQTLGNSFILGHSTKGILGTSRLGSDLGSWEVLTKNTTVQTFTNTGLNEIRDYYYDDSGNYPTHIAMGNNSTAFIASQTTLVSEFGSRVSISRASGPNYITYTGAFSPVGASGSSFQEAGVFTAASSGTMYARRILASSITIGEDYNYRLIFTATGMNILPLVNLSLYNTKDFLYGSGPTQPTHIAWASSTATSSITDTTITGEIDRNAWTATQKFNKKVRYTGILATGEGNDYNINKVGVYNAASGSGELLMEFDYAPISKNQNFSITNYVELKFE